MFANDHLDRQGDDFYWQQFDVLMLLEWRGVIFKSVPGAVWPIETPIAVF